ncbi:MAG: hypothetical protein ABTD50_01915 [Polyangiaceae bacterium]|jgi:hypothetical protein
MPIVVAPFLGFALGAFLAWVAAPSVARDQGPLMMSRPFVIVAFFAACAWLPISGYFLAFHGDWSYLYLVSWQRVPSAIDLGLVLLATAAVVGGFSAAARPVRRRRFDAVAALVLAPIAVTLVVLGTASRRLSISGTYAQYHGDFGTQPIASSVLGTGLLFMDCVLLAAIGWTTYWLLRLEGTAGR